jgi:hypothetical protein
MRTRQFEIPQELIADFFTTAEQEDLEIELIEVNEDDELVVEIQYDNSERDSVMNLVELLDDYYGEEDEE